MFIIIYKQKSEGFTRYIGNTDIDLCCSFIWRGLIEKGLTCL